jgi:uncharacterized protein (DUF433 family)
MEWHERLSIDSEVLVGKPAVKGTRISVEFVIDLLASGWAEVQILGNYPQLHPDDLRACLQYASHILHAEKVYPIR